MSEKELKIYLPKLRGGGLEPGIYSLQIVWESSLPSVNGERETPPGSRRTGSTNEPERLWHLLKIIYHKPINQPPGAGHAGPERRTMFFKTSGFKRLLKSANKSNSLKIANDGSGIIIAGSYWTIWIDQEIPKEKKAAIIEFCGDLPKPGEQIKIEYGMNQIEIPDDLIMGTATRAYAAKELLTDTGIIIRPDLTDIHLFQAGSGRIIAAADHICKLIDWSAEEEIEDRVRGPYLRGERLYWRTDLHALELWPIRLNEETERLTDYLEGIKIDRGKAKIPEDNGKEKEEDA